MAGGDNPGFLQQLKDFPMNTTPSGLQFVDSVVGDGKIAQAGHDVTVHYTGWLWVDGAKTTKFKQTLEASLAFPMKTIVFVRRPSTFSTRMATEPWIQTS